MSRFNVMPRLNRLVDIFIAGAIRILLGREQAHRYLDYAEQRDAK